MFYLLEGELCEKMSGYRIEEWLMNEVGFSQSIVMETCQKIPHKYYFHSEMIFPVVHIYPKGRVDLELLLNVCDSNLKTYRFSILFPVYIRRN